jgi:glycosyl transferase family 2
VTGERYLSPFEQLAVDTALVDRAAREPDAPTLDVIMPLVHANEMFRANLLSIYREVPVGRLLIGNAGVDDATRAVLDEFPRVEMLDQRANATLGACLRQLVEAVATDWFVYFHSDVWLPRGWFDAMWPNRERYEWFECNRRKTMILDYVDAPQNTAARPFSGSQMGRRDILQGAVAAIDDDFLYRNEDLIIQELVEAQGGRYGRVSDTWHHHQLINKPGDAEADIAEVRVDRVDDRDWVVRTRQMQWRGIVKYAKPDKDYLVQQVAGSFRELASHDALDCAEALVWTRETDPDWLPQVRSALATFGKAYRIRRQLGVIRRALAEIARTLLGR